MKTFTFSPDGPYPVALLIKDSAFRETQLDTTYAKFLEDYGISKDQIIFYSLPYNEHGKAPSKLIKESLAAILLNLRDKGTQFIYCADANYFKVLAGVRKAEPNLGYVLPCKFDEFTEFEVTLGINHKSLLYNPANESKLLMSLNTLVSAVNQNYQELGTNIIHKAHYPQTETSIKKMLDALHQYPALTCDIETFSLDHDKAGIGTITFCVDEHQGLAFACDYQPLKKPDEQGNHGIYVNNPEVQALIREFFETYQGKLIFHRANFDIKVLVYTLWMEDLLDTNGLLKGLEILTRSFDDTRLIAYLALNSCAGNHLSLKDLAHEFAGNWAQDDIKDIRKIPFKELLQYNLVDGLSTWYVHKKYYPQMQADNQEALYQSMMLPSQQKIIQVELTGMPLNPRKVQQARKVLEATLEEQVAVLQASPEVQKTQHLLYQAAWEKDFEDRKRKAKNPDKIKKKVWEDFLAKQKPYNPNSPKQTQMLLYEVMGLPVIDLTDTKQPSTEGDTLEKLKHHTENPDYLAVINALREWTAADKVLGTFIKAFEQAIDKGDGVVWLHGNFNLGGTKSGRLSSSDPNLQNIPAGSKYGKLVKDCFEAPDGWIFCGADFNSLEDYVSALTTKDSNKLKVYLEGYDGHCLRAFSYFRDEMPDIVDTVVSINSIKDKYPKLRQKSKGPTFALTYQGTYYTLMNSLGLPEDDAKKIEANYHDLYQESDAWVQDKLAEAARRGYVEVAFGLRLRTPLLASTLWGSKHVPYEAQAEGRTAGNALGQSYGLLTNRACNEFMDKVWKSPYRFDVKPVAMIHDAIYLLIRDDLGVVEWVNRELIKSMQWQELPELVHDKVKLGAALDLFWPSWANPLTLPNGASKAEIVELTKTHGNCVRGIHVWKDRKCRHCKKKQPEQEAA